MRDTEVQPLVSDGLLAELANPDAQAQRGEYDAVTRALLSAALPEMASELLRWREAARYYPDALSLALRSEAIACRIDTARRTIRAPDPVPAAAMRDACETLIRHSRHADERAAARDVLAQMREAA